jgi:hypothetical protein
MDQKPDEFDRQIRQHIYEVTLGCGYPPTLAETSGHFRVTIPDVKAAFERLAAGHIIVLQGDTGEILMANPFSAVPTPFLVELAEFSCYGNCIWDALGIPAILHKDARIKTACGDCGTAMEVKAVNGTVQGAVGLVHFAIPALHWWDDIVFN